MKRIVLILACIIFSSAVFADKLVRIVNNDATQDLKVELQSCAVNFDASIESCKDLPTELLRNYAGGKHYKDITIPNDSEDAQTFLHVVSVTSLQTGAYSNFQDGRSLKYKYCSSSDRHNPILLNTHRTDSVFCDNAMDGIDKHDTKKINKK